MNLIEQLKRDEGLSLTMYECPSGDLTIGYGHNLEANPITEYAAERILHDDIAAVDEQLRKALPWTTGLMASIQDNPRYNALVNLAFNMGVGGLLSFTKMLENCQRGLWIEAAQELLDSEYGRGVTKNRAARLAKQLITGEYQ